MAERVARVAGGLRGRGLPGDRVLLSLENCGEFLELLFGCWAAGLCAVPANARLHPREVEYIADNSGARLLLATPALAEALAPLAGSVETLDAVISTRSADYAALLAAEPLPPEPAQPTDPAWLFYTTGTTGRPKGAVLTHRNLLFASQCYYADIDQLDERDTHLHAAPLSHGAGLYALPFLLQGRAPDRPAAFRCRRILDVIARHPARLVFRGADDADPPRPRARSRRRRSRQSARRSIYGGGPMYVADLESALELFGPRLYQLYGQGESPMTITGLTQRHARRHRAPELARPARLLRRRAHRRAGQDRRRATTASCRPARSARSSRAATA